MPESSTYEAGMRVGDLFWLTVSVYGQLVYCTLAGMRHVGRKLVCFETSRKLKQKQKKKKEKQ